MARAWVYDRTKRQTYRDAVKRAKASGRKPPGRWEVQYYDRAGKLRSEVVTTKTRAEDRRTELEASLASGTYIDPTAAKIGFAEIADKWIDARPDLRPSTWWKYRGLLDNHVIPRWGGHALSVIETEDVAVWVASLLESTADGGSGLGPSQARHAYRVLSMVLDWCVPARLLRNPARGVKLPVRPEAEHVYLTYAQVEAVRVGVRRVADQVRPTDRVRAHQPAVDPLVGVHRSALGRGRCPTGWESRPGQAACPRCLNAHGSPGHPAGGPAEERQAAHGASACIARAGPAPAGRRSG